MTSLDDLIELQSRRKFYISVMTRQTNAAKALVRRALGWKWDDEETEREDTKGRVSRITAAALAGREQKPEDVEAYEKVRFDIEVVRMSLEPHEAARKAIEKEMRARVVALPVYPWAKGVRGFGELGLAVILAETGDPGKYPSKGHFWKRLGLAPFNGKAMSTWRTEGGLTADEWVACGYSPRRRAEMYAVIGDPLFRQQTVVTGPYRQVYDRRRAAATEAHPDWTKAHLHNDALRVMTKALLRDLWKEWNRRA